MSRALCFVALLAGIVVAAEGDWPQWRGPNRDGVASGAKLPDVLPPNLKLVWKAEVGAGYSGPVIAGGKVVVFSRQGENEVVRCLSASDGKELWKDGYAAPYKPASVAAKHGKGPFATPTIAGGKVFTFGINSALRAQDLAGGKTLWQITSPVHPSWGASNSPLVEGNLVILGVGAKGIAGLTAFDVETGKEVWQQTADGAAYSSPVAADLAGRRQIIALMEHHLLAVEPKEGKVLWQTRLVVQYEQNIFTPIIRKDLVIASGWGQPIRADRIAQNGGKFTATEAWRNEREAFFMNTPVLAGGHLYGLADRGRGTLVCISAEDGKTKWSGASGLGEYASIVAAGDKLLVLTTNGTLLLVAASPAGCKELGKASLGQGAYWAHIALAGGRIYVRDKTNVACFELKAE